MNIYDALWTFGQQIIDWFATLITNPFGQLIVASIVLGLIWKYKNRV